MAQVSGFELWMLKKQFSDKMRLSMYMKLVRFIKNGVQLTEALDIMYQHASQDGKKPKAVQAVVVDAWRKNLRNGMNFGRAIAGWVPEADRILIESGAESGSLDEAIENAIFIQGASKQIGRAVKAGVSYPAFLVLVAVGLMIFFATNVIPAFEEVVPRSKWEGGAENMAVISDFVNYYLQWVALALVAVGALIGWSMPRWTGPVRVFFDTYVPPWTIYRLTRGSGFLLGLASMVKAGITIRDALIILMRGASPWYKERISRTLTHLRNGDNLGEALYKTGLAFPDIDTVNDLRAYAGLDGFEEILDKIGRDALEDAVAKITAQAAIVRNVGLVVLGVVFGLITSGLLSLQSAIANNAN